MTLSPVRLADLTTFGDYLESLSAPFDSYLERAITSSRFYRVTRDDREIGGIAVHEDSLLTYFHLAGSHRRHARTVWASALAEFPIAAAYVPTCDEQFLSQVLEDVPGAREVRNQACIFVDGSPVDGSQVDGSPVDGFPVDGAPPADLTYRLAEPADATEIRAVSGDFLDRLDERIADREVHVGTLGGDVVAVGLAEPSRFFPRHASIGMFTHEAHRQRGIGTATIRVMRRVCRDAGVTPIAGCWYYNHGSRKTLEAAGMITKTRLLRIEFRTDFVHATR